MIAESRPEEKEMMITVIMNCLKWFYVIISFSSFVVRNKHNTPGIVKFSFWQMTMQNPNAVYACVNLDKADVPQEIAGRSICIQGDIGEMIKVL